MPWAQFFLPRQAALASSIRGTVFSLSFHSLPERLLCFMLALVSRIPRQGISHHRTLTWGVIALGHRGHIEEVSTETQQGDWSGVWGEWVQPRFTRLLSLQLVKTAELDPSRNYLAGFHPHGVLATGAFINLCTEGTGFSSVFPGIRSYLMMMHWCFWVPIYRDYIMFSGEFFLSFYPRTMGAEDRGGIFNEDAQLFYTSSK